MTEEQIKQNAKKYAIKICEETPIDYRVVSDAYIEGARSRDEEIEELKKQLAAMTRLKNSFAGGVDILDNDNKKLQEELNQLRNPWVTDRDPEIKGSISDAVLLLVDGMFYKVSRLERRKDGSEFWWGVDVVNGEEVTAWMPIPQEPNND